MKISKVNIKDFKRFKDLTLDLGDKPAKIIALVGTNGCGKSSVLDAFIACGGNYSGGHIGSGSIPEIFYRTDNKNAYQLISLTIADYIMIMISIRTTGKLFFHSEARIVTTLV